MGTPESARHRIFALLFLNAIEVTVTVVPYKGTGPALNDLIGGQFDFMCDQTLNVFQPVRGLIKAYAATTKKRLAVLPDLPTAAESGLPDFEITVWFGMWAPKGTPKPVIDTLSAALQKALKDPEVSNRLAAAGAETVSSERAEREALRAHLKSEVDRWTLIIKKAGVSAD
jgi:tripartite-type tricarboxylate transporter receptor subunit TctC